MSKLTAAELSAKGGLPLARNRPVAKLGDTMTFSGVYLDKPNPAWRRWAFWRPRRVASSELQTYRVVGATSSEIVL